MTADPTPVPVGAHVHWDAQWRTAQGQAAWSRPEPSVVELATGIRDAGGADALDLGCGVGRHALAMAQLGLTAYGVDRSAAGIEQARHRAAELGVSVRLTEAGMDRLPYPADSFDLVVAWNVIYHGTGADAAAAVAEVVRVLRPGGRYQSTMLSKRNAEYGRGVEIDRDVYVQPDGPEDKAHPHLYCDLDDVLRLHAPLRPLAAVDREHGRPGSFHWHLLFEAP